jgi:phenylalanine ammonia-lyase
MATPVSSFTDLVLSQWRDPLSSAKRTLAVDGGNLTVADVVAVARDLIQVELTSESIEAIELCSKVIPEKIAKGDIIYGVNTGFGGSADTRSDDVERVQQSLISHLTCGIVADSKRIGSLPLNDPLAATCMPESWARASMLIRLNSLAGGASGIRVDIAESLEKAPQRGHRAAHPCPWEYLGVGRSQRARMDRSPDARQTFCYCIR